MKLIKFAERGSGNFSIYIWSSHLTTSPFDVEC